MTHEKLDAQSAAIEEIRQLMLARAESREGISPAELERLRADAAEMERYRKLYLEVKRANPSLQELLDAGDLAGAARRKEEQIARQRSDQAQSYFELGAIEELRFDFAKALEAYREAWRLEKNPTYGFKCGYCAQRQNCFVEAIGAYEALRTILVEPSDVATTLNNLAVLYRDTQRLEAAESACAKALSLRRKLASGNPAAYLPYVARTLNNLAVLYSATQRLRAAESAYAESLSLRRELASGNPAAYLPDVASTLNNLAVLYSATQRLGAAESAYAEALSLRRELALRNPAAYLPDVAMTLINLANLYYALERYDAGAARCVEAEEVLEPLWRVNPAVHGNRMARILGTRVLLGEAQGEASGPLCALARRGLGMAYDPGLRAALQGLIERLCGDAADRPVA